MTDKQPTESTEEEILETPGNAPEREEAPATPHEADLQQLTEIVADLAHAVQALMTRPTTDQAPDVRQAVVSALKDLAEEREAAIKWRDDFAANKDNQDIAKLADQAAFLHHLGVSDDEIAAFLRSTKEALSVRRRPAISTEDQPSGSQIPDDVDADLSRVWNKII